MPLAFGGWRNLSAGVALRRFLLRQGVDFLNTHSSLDSWVGALAWRSLGRWPALVRTRHLSTRVKANWPTRWLYQSPGAIITTGQFTRQLLMTRLGVPRRRIFSIPTGVDLARFSPTPKPLALARELNIPENAFIIGAVAVLRSWKGHLYLVEALAQLLQDGVDAYLVIVGDGPYREVIAGKVAELDLASRVRLAGHQEDVRPWFALMDAVALASYANEGVPQALLQALAMGQAVVGTTVGGIPEVVIGDETGLLVWPRDAQALAQALRQLRDDPDLARQLGRRGRELVQERFSLEQMAQELEAIYEVVLGQPAK
jgi:glycosyltransferase involved in cell wall biosynthesis